MRPTIESPLNPSIKAACRLHRREHRHLDGRFLIEGLHLIEEALAIGWPLETIYFSAAEHEPYEEMLSVFRLRQPERQLHTASTATPVLQPVSSAVLRKLSTTASPAPIIAVAKQIGATIPSVANGRLVLAVESMQDPGNLGTMIRTAAAVGGVSVVTSLDSVDGTNPKVLRSSAGSWFRCPPSATNLMDLVSNSRRHGIPVLATSANGECYWSVDLTGPMVLLLGNEGGGISPRLMSLATKVVSIPMVAGVESLNVSMAGGLILYERQRQLALESTTGGG